MSMKLCPLGWVVRLRVAAMSLRRYMPMPAGLEFMVERSAPRALIAPPIPTKRAVPFRSEPTSDSTLYISCAEAMSMTMLATKAKTIFLFIILSK